jgi:hypothetical protein
MTMVDLAGCGPQRLEVCPLPQAQNGRYPRPGQPLAGRLPACQTVPGTPPGVRIPTALGTGSRHPFACSATPARTIEPGSPLK